MYGTGDSVSTEQCLALARESAVDLEQLVVNKSLPDARHDAAVKVLFSTYIQSTKIAWDLEQKVRQKTGCLLASQVV